MMRIYRFRDTQRFIFLLLLFPLVPLLIEWLRPKWAPLVLAGVALYVGYTFWMLFRLRDLEILEAEIRIDSGRWQQVLSPADIAEISLVKHQGMQFRIGEQNRMIRLLASDYREAVTALEQFARRHAIPLTDKRPDQQAEQRREVS